MNNPDYVNAYMQARDICRKHLGDAVLSGDPENMAVSVSVLVLAGVLENYAHDENELQDCHRQIDVLEERIRVIKAQHASANKRNENVVTLMREMFKQLDRHQGFTHAQIRGAIALIAGCLDSLYPSNDFLSF